MRRRAWIVAPCFSVLLINGCGRDFSDADRASQSTVDDGSDTAFDGGSGLDIPGIGSVDGGGSVAAPTPSADPQPGDVKADESIGGGASTPPQTPSTGGGGGGGAGPPVDASRGGTDVSVVDAGPTGSASECVDDLDCDDADACNGVETCGDDGRCQEGTPACPNPDTEHCERLCSDVDGTAVCGPVTARDMDGDEHGDPLCEFADNPGDDCDDDDETRYPGAPEVCDGVDNDCDRLVDIDDGVPIWGSFQTMAPPPANFADIAWAPDASVFGVLHETPEPRQVRFVRLDPLGNQLGGLQLTPTGSGFPSLTATDEVFGAAWGDTRDGPEDIFMQQLDFDGALLGDEIRITTTEERECCPMLAKIPGGDWVVGYGSQDSGTGTWRLDLLSVSEAGEVGEPVTVSTTPVMDWHPNIAVSDGQFAFVWTFDDGPPYTYWTRRAFDFSVLEEGLLDGFRGRGVVFGDDGGFALAASDHIEDSVSFMRKGFDGATLCGPVELSGTDGEVGGWEPGLSASPEGYVVVGSVAGTFGRIVMWRVARDCTEIGGPYELDIYPEPGGWYSAPHVIVTDDSIVVTHSDNAAGVNQVRRRIFGHDFCGPPGGG